MRFKIYLFLAEFLTLCYQFNFIIANPLVGEKVRNAHEGEFPYIVSFRYSKRKVNKPENAHAITGSLISNKDILTAAHGFKHVEAEKYDILVGSIDVLKGNVYYAAWWISFLQWTIANHKKSKFEINDIAIVRLIDEVPDEITPAIILPIPDNALFGQEVQIAGWGKLTDGNSNRFLNAATLTVISRKECEQRVSNLVNCGSYMPDNYLCSRAEPWILSTSGNSGSPIIYSGHLVAIHKGICPKSSSYNPGKVNIHIPIFNFEKFIETVLKT